ncbi:MAG: transposase [Candidatus Omnitrophica bacterium]|nr:transposase [Candidatus Omnitrophota bacterium]MBU4488370.1 transposase [Candidatus Omnitrophota bacterium]
MYQPNLIFTKDTNLTYLRQLELVFSCLDIPDKNYHTGRPPYPVSSMINALVFKNLRGLSNLVDLTRELNCYPALTQACGFKSFPSKERFSHFLKYTPNELLRRIKENLIKELMLVGEIKAEYLSTDSCPVKSPVKENNLKTNVKDRFDKNKLPKTDKEARLGAYVVYPSGKKIQFFWGYRNHIVNDAVSELPLAEITKPANVHEATLLISQLEYLKDAFKISPKAVIADSAFDSSTIIEHIVKELKAKPVIAKNPRGGANPNIRLSSKGTPICQAGFEMISCGKFYDKEQNRMRHKFACPIKMSKKFARKTGWFCPWNHPKFFSNRYGCTINLRIDVDTSIRQNIDYGSQTFKKLYNLRTSSERIFARLLMFAMQRCSVKGLNATANLCSLAHISVLAVALAAVKSGGSHKLRFIKSFFTV